MKNTNITDDGKPVEGSVNMVEDIEATQIPLSAAINEVPENANLSLENDDILFQSHPVITEDTGSPERLVFSQDTNKLNTTCRYFRKGSCKHGMKGRECRYTHPKVCSKFTQHGTRKDRGCNLGKRCKYFHPQMCLESLRKGQCFSTKCPFNHIKGTKRHPSVIDNKVESVSPQSQIKTTDVLPSPDKNEDSKQKQDDHKQYDTGHF